MSLDVVHPHERQPAGERERLSHLDADQQRAHEPRPAGHRDAVEVPQLAARFAHRVLLLFGDGRWQYGATAESLTPETLSELYLTAVSALQLGERRVFVLT